MLEPPTRLKKVGDGIKVDIEKTSGDEVSRKKNKVKFSKKVKKLWENCRKKTRTELVKRINRRKERKRKK